MKKRYLQFSKNWRHAGLVTAFAITTSLSVQAQTAPAKQWDKTIGGAGFDNLTCVRQTTDGGYILGGHSESGISGDKSQVSQGMADFWVVKTDANGVKLWDKTFGGNATETFRFIQQTTDGGYILAGTSASGISGNKTQASKGLNDFWIVKIDALGVKQWDKAFGGSADDNIFAIQQTTDGGYILGGSSKSGINGDKSQANVGDFDYWVVKLDGSGTKQWDKTFGGSAADELYALRQTADGGYILGGTSKSAISGDKTQASKGLGDYWIIKIDGNGVKTWDKAFGGSGDETGLWALQQTTDGGYIMGGTSPSPISGDKTEASKGTTDFWVVKTDGSGVKTWDKTIGGSSSETLRTMQQTSDGGYIMGGFSTSGVSGDKSEVSKGNVDYWVVKLNGSGVKTWDKTIGATNADNLHTLHQTADGGFILGGMSDSGLNGDKSQALIGGPADFWIVKLAASQTSAPGDMSVSAITSVNSGCGLSNQETITITVNNMGTASQSNIPVSYKIGATGTPVNEIIAGPVQPNTSVTYSFTQKANLSTLGTYVIEARTNLTGDALPSNDVSTKTVTNYATPSTPTITNSGSAALCSGSAVTLTAASTTTGATYQWYLNGTAITGATSATYSANAAGNYTATAIVGNSCASSASNIIALTLNTTPPAPGINLTGTAAICSGDSAILTANSAVTGATFTWFNNGNLIQGATSANLIIKAAGSYTAVATANGCASPASVARVITIKQRPVAPIISKNGNLLTSSIATGNQWYKNGTAIPGAVAPTLNVSSNGAYTAKVTANGCASLASNTITIANTGINDEQNNLQVAVYPNPSNGLFTLNLQKGHTYTFVITDLTGKVIEQKTVKTKTAQLDLSKAAKGIYLLNITSEYKTATRKLFVE
ncbi:T9SS type A sorting domain-containing protein [Adhaeribacter terreus]|uniref:T9SS type A sorting domain-containing protein n=1 Tax=Adhaeribacter terreus TaxID=529703 RepID=A0ABW0E8T3_9BACT